MTSTRSTRAGMPALRMLTLALALVAMPGMARTPQTTPLQVPAHGVIGVADAQLSPDF